MTWNGGTYNVDLSLNLFQMNIYNENYVSAGKALIDIVSSPRNYFAGEIFQKNGESSLQAINAYGMPQTGMSSASDEINMQNLVSNSGSLPITTELMKSLIYI